MVEDLLTNKWFSIVILIILIFTLLMYYNKPCTTPVTVQGFENLDLSTALPNITQYPFNDTKYAPYGRVNGRFDMMADQAMLAKMRSRGIEGGFLPSLDQRYVGRNGFNRGNIGMPDVIRWDGQIPDGWSNNRWGNNGWGNNGWGNNGWGYDGIETMDNLTDPSTIDLSNYVCYQKSQSKTLSDLQNSGMKMTPDQYNSLSSYVQQDSSSPTWDEIKAYLNDAKNKVQQTVSDYRNNNSGMTGGGMGNTGYTGMGGTGSGYTGSGDYVANGYDNNMQDYKPYYEAAKNDLSQLWTDITSGIMNNGTNAPMSGGSTVAPVIPATPVAPAVATARGVRRTNNPNGCSIM